MWYNKKQQQIISHGNTRTCAVNLITLLNNTRGHDRCILLCASCLWFLTCYWHKKYWFLAYYCSITVLGWKPRLEPDQAQAQAQPSPQLRVRLDISQAQALWSPTPGLEPKPGLAHHYFWIYCPLVLAPWSWSSLAPGPGPSLLVPWLVWPRLHCIM